MKLYDVEVFGVKGPEPIRQGVPLDVARAVKDRTESQAAGLNVPISLRIVPAKPKRLP